MTDREKRVLDLAIQWRMSKYAIAEALVEAEFKREIDLLIKERRDKKVQEVENESFKT